MRLLELIEDTSQRTALWFNTRTKMLIAVPDQESHAGLVLKDPTSFGIRHKQINRINQTTDGEFGDWIFHLVMKNHWVRIDLGKQSDIPYVTAISHQDARIALRMMVEKSLIQFEVLVEIETHPGRRPWSTTLKNEQIDDYIKSGRIPSQMVQEDVQPSILRNPQFRAWFGNSTVVDQQGNPMVVFHGTPSPLFDRFEHRKGITTFMGIPVEVQRHGFYFAENEAFAREFHNQPRGRGKGGVIPVYLSIQNPLRITYESGIYWKDSQKLAAQGVDMDWMEKYVGNPMNTWEFFDDKEGEWFVKAIKEAGFDGVFFEENNPRTDATENVWLAFYPQQIKSAVQNTGRYDPQNHRIHEEAVGPNPDHEYPPYGWIRADGNYVSTDHGRYAAHRFMDQIKQTNPHIRDVRTALGYLGNDGVYKFAFDQGWVRVAYSIMDNKFTVFVQAGNQPRPRALARIINYIRKNPQWNYAAEIGDRYQEYPDARLAISGLRQAGRALRESGYIRTSEWGDKEQVVDEIDYNPIGWIRADGQYVRTNHGPYVEQRFGDEIRRHRSDLADPQISLYGSLGEGIYNYAFEQGWIRVRYRHRYGGTDHDLVFQTGPMIRAKAAARAIEMIKDLGWRNVGIDRNGAYEEMPSKKAIVWLRNYSRLKESWDNYQEIGHFRGAKLWYLLKGGKLIVDDVGYMMHGATPEDFETASQERDGLENHNPDVEEKTLAVGRIDDLRKKISIRTPLAPGNSYFDLPERTIEFAAKKLRQRYPDYEIWYFGKGASEIRQIMEDQRPKTPVREVPDRHQWEDEHTAAFRVGPYDFEARFVGVPGQDDIYIRYWRTIGRRPEGGTGLFPRITAMLKKITQEWLNRVKPEALEIEGEDPKRNAFNAQNYGRWTPPGYKFVLLPSRPQYDQDRAWNGVRGVAFVRNDYARRYQAE
jgi:hypothetical protein